MRGAPLFLFLFGAATGAISVAVSIFRRAARGEYPTRWTPPPIREKRKRKSRRGRIRTILLDFIFTFLTGTYLVLYDATVLGGLGRLYHFAFFLSGFFLLRRLLLFRAYRPCEWVVRLIYDLVRAFVLWLLFPIQKCFSFLFGILSALYLILKQKNAKIKRKKEAKREIKRLYAESDTAFLPAFEIGTFVPGRD